MHRCRVKLYVPEDRMTTTRRALRLRNPSRGGFLLLAVIAGGVAVGTYLVADRVSAKNDPSAPAPGVATVHPATPATAREFATDFVTLSNAYGAQHGQTERLTGADCVQASPGHFMCSYTVVRPGRRKECHLMQAEWTPNGASSFKVTLAGRVARCHTLSEALRSLK
jgi:hypothetical protein